MASTSAIIDGFVLPFAPEAVSWGYHLNTNSQDTLGGRVIQILSVNITSMTWTGVAGSRNGLLAVVNKIEDIMQKHIQTQRPVTLSVPSKNWTFNVYVSSMPRIGWDVTTVSYPYTLGLEVDQDFGSISPIIMQDQINRLAAQIGYDPAFHGPIDTAPSIPDPVEPAAPESTTNSIFKPAPTVPPPPLNPIIDPFSIRAP